MASLGGLSARCLQLFLYPWSHCFHSGPSPPLPEDGQIFPSFVSSFFPPCLRPFHFLPFSFPLFLNTSSLRVLRLGTNLELLFPACRASGGAKREEQGPQFPESTGLLGNGVRFLSVLRDRGCERVT